MARTGVRPAPRRGGFFRLLMTLVAGAILGGMVLLLIRPEAVVREAERRVPAPTVTVTASPPPGVTRLSVDVPDACLDALQRAGSSAGKVRELVEAVQGLHVNRARELAGELQREHPEQLTGLTSDCRVALDQITGGPTPSASVG